MKIFYIAHNLKLSLIIIKKEKIMNCLKNTHFKIKINSTTTIKKNKKIKKL